MSAETAKEWKDALRTMRAVIVHGAFAYSQASGESAQKLEADFNRALDVILAHATPPTGEGVSRAVALGRTVELVSPKHGAKGSYICGDCGASVDMTTPLVICEGCKWADWT